MVKENEALEAVKLVESILNDPSKRNISVYEITKEMEQVITDLERLEGEIEKVKQRGYELNAKMAAFVYRDSKQKMPLLESWELGTFINFGISKWIKERKIPREK